jgi:ribosomal protein S1
MKQYRREAMQQLREKELEEERKNFQLDYSKMYKPGDPGTVQGVIREINSVGYFVTLPNGREGFLSAMHLGCSGGIPLLERLMQVGSEVTVRVIPVYHPGGRDRCYVRP